MVEACIFDKKTILFAGDVQCNTVAFGEIGLWFLYHYLFLLRSSWAVLNCAFKLSLFLSPNPVNWYTGFNIHFFCSRLFLLRISAGAWAMNWAAPVKTESQKQHMTFLASPVCSACHYSCKALNDCCWEFNNFRVLMYSSTKDTLPLDICHELDFNITFILQDKW